MHTPRSIVIILMVLVYGCNTLQHNCNTTATHCNTLQHTHGPSIWLQHTTTHMSHARACDMTHSYVTCIHRGVWGGYD